MSRAKPGLGLVLVATLGFGCWEQVSATWFSQMKEQPAVQALEDTQPLVPPEGTIPFGGIEPRIGPDDPMAANPMHSPVARGLENPVKRTEESIAQGAYVYGIYCAVCHGPDGMTGMVNQPVGKILTENGAPPLPLASVACIVPVTDPPPEPTAKVTVAFETRLPTMSRTSTVGSVATAVLTVADWLSPEAISIVAGVPGPAVAVAVVLTPVTLTTAMSSVWV